MERHEKVHSFYIVTGLILLVILVSTARFGDQSSLIQYINFAASISSLILAILAIVYAFLSNDGVSSTLRKLEECSEKLEDNASSVNASAKALDSGGENIKKAVTGVGDQLAALSNNIREIRAEFGKIPGAIGEVEKKVVLTHELMSKLTDPQTPAATGTRPQPHTPAAQPEAHFQSFIDHSSISGLRLIYAAYLCAKSGKRVNINKLFTTIMPGNEQYFFGFFVATIAAGIFIVEERDADVYKLRVNQTFSMLLEASLPEIKSDDQSLLKGDKGWDAVVIRVQNFLKENIEPPPAPTKK